MAILDNPRHELFCQELAKGTRQDAAYLAAGYNGDKTSASRLAAQPEIRARVQELLAAIAERAEISREMVVRELGRIGFSDIRSMFTKTGAMKRIEDLDDDTAAAIASVEVVTKRVPGGDAAEVEHVAKIKTWDKRAALVDIAKMQGWHIERHELTGKDGADLIPAMDDTELARLMVFALSKATNTP